MKGGRRGNGKGTCSFASTVLSTGSQLTEDYGSYYYMIFMRMNCWFFFFLII